MRRRNRAKVAASSNKYSGAKLLITAVIFVIGAGGIWLWRGGFRRPAEPTPRDAQTDVAPSTNVFPPPELADSSWLRGVREAQLQAASSVQAFHDFTFTDRLIESGITWRSHIVDDAGKNYKSVHYDHGTGMAVADVDGDGLLDIYFVSQVGPNALMRNLGGGKFEDITARAGVALPDAVKVSASFADIDNDGAPDLYVTTVRGGNHLFHNDGHGVFTDITAGSGLGYVGHSSSAVFFDYNRDGLLDLFLVNVGRYTSDRVITMSDGHKYYESLDHAFAGHLFPERAEASLLFRNDGGGHFTDVSREMGLQHAAWSGDAAPIDVNEDGWPDLYVLSMQGNDDYYENQGGKRFVKKSRALFPKTSWGAMGIKPFDVDNDGHLDIYITDMHSDMSALVDPAHERMKSAGYPPELLGAGANPIFGNSLFLNNGHGRFIEVSDRMNAENYWPWGLSVGDINADGYDDAFIASSMNYHFRYGINSLKLNEGGQRFADAEFILGIEPRRDGRTMTPWFELDASGADRDHPDARGHTGRLTVWAAIGSRSSAMFDLDNDGDLDIVTNDFNSEPLVLISNLSERRALHFLKVKLVGSTSNRDGLGATVRVTAGGRTYMKVNDGLSGHLSHSLIPLYFGLDTADRVDRVEVIWPSGHKQIVSDVHANSQVEIREP
jgi:hypothetical protein